MSSMSTSSESKPKLSPVILEAMVRNLSDHDLLRFMLSSKEAFNATLDALSTVDYVNIHDENFENEPCIAFRMRGDFEDKSESNYITKSNPIFNFVVNYLKGRLIGLKTCNLVEIEPWILNALMTSRLEELSLGIVLPKSCKKILKHAPNLFKITFSTFDVFVASNFIPSRCEDVAVDFLELYEIKRILKLPFTPSNVVENISLGRDGMFVVDYDRYEDDYSRTLWKSVLNFLTKAFPSLETLKIYLNGYSQLPMKTIRWFNTLSHLFTAEIMSSNIEINVQYDVMIPPSEWLAYCFALHRPNADDMASYLDLDDKIKRAIKNRCFPDDLHNRFFYCNKKIAKLDCIYGLILHTNWDEYDFDAENNQEYTLWDTLPASSEEDSSSVNTLSTQSLSETSELDLVAARDAFWSHESEISDFDDTLKCIEFFITDSSQSLITQNENSVKSDTEMDTTSTSEDSTSDEEDSDTSSVSDTNSDSSNETTLTDDCDESNTETITTVTSECSTCVSDASTQDSFTD